MSNQTPQITQRFPILPMSRTWTEIPKIERPDDAESIREKMMDKTLADSYSCSDAPSTIPNPEAMTR